MDEAVRSLTDQTFETRIGTDWEEQRRGKSPGDSEGNHHALGYTNWKNVLGVVGRIKKIDCWHYGNCHSGGGSGVDRSTDQGPTRERLSTRRRRGTGSGEGLHREVGVGGSSRSLTATTSGSGEPGRLRRGENTIDGCNEGGFDQRKPCFDRLGDHGGSINDLIGSQANGGGSRGQYRGAHRKLCRRADQQLAAIIWGSIRSSILATRASGRVRSR